MMETMFTHITLPQNHVDFLAKGNAYVNLCLANNAIDKNLAYAFNNVVAQTLDITVLDRDFYKASYTATLNQGMNETFGTAGRSACSELEGKLPTIIGKLTNDYNDYYRTLRVARAEERKQMVAMLNGIGTRSTQASYPVTYGWPTVKFAQSEPPSTTVLVNTSKGLIQCRTTNKNVVFCM